MLCFSWQNVHDKEVYPHEKAFYAPAGGAGAAAKLVLGGVVLADEQYKPDGNDPVYAPKAAPPAGGYMDTGRRDGRNGICAAGHWRDEQRMTLLVVQSDEKGGDTPALFPQISKLEVVRLEEILYNRYVELLSAAVGGGLQENEGRTSSL